MRAGALLLLLAALLSGCGEAKPFVPAADGSNYINFDKRLVLDNELSSTAAQTERRFNFWQSLSVPTLMTRIKDTWFIVDCYHNQIIFNDAPDAQYISLTDWQVVNSDITQAHTIAGDGETFLIDDTENARVLVLTRVADKFINTQTYWNVGSRPHYAVYDEKTDTFYVWSSLTGELYLFRKARKTHDVYLTEIRSIERLRGIYIRSFTIEDNRIWFVSGVPSQDNPSYRPAILCCDLDTLEVLAEYPVPDSIAGMTQLFHARPDLWFVSVSTDAEGNQDAAALLKTDSPDSLSKGSFEDIYPRSFIGGGTPYYISQVDDYYYLTEHRLEDHAIWRFQIDEDGEPTDVVTLY